MTPKQKSKTTSNRPCRRYNAACRNRRTGNTQRARRSSFPSATVDRLLALAFAATRLAHFSFRCSRQPAAAAGSRLEPEPPPDAPRSPECGARRFARIECRRQFDGPTTGGGGRGRAIMRKLETLPSVMSAGPRLSVSRAA